MITEQERAEFEAWYEWEYSEAMPCGYSPHGYYLDARIQLLFRCYQAGRAALQSKDREDALTKLVAACPTNLHCDDFHHTKADQHMSNEACPPLVRYIVAIDHARCNEGGSHEPI